MLLESLNIPYVSHTNFKLGVLSYISWRARDNSKLYASLRAK